MILIDHINLFKIKLRFIIILLISFLPIEAFLQNQSKAWVVGYDNNDKKNPKFGITYLDFSGEIVKLNYFENFNYSKTFFLNTSISNQFGDLILFSDGLNLYGNDFAVIENGNDLNPGEVRNDFNPEYYPAAYNHILLPRPGYENEYVLFHISLSYNRDPGEQIRSVKADKMLFSAIKMDSLSSNFKVYEKNILILSEDLNISHLAYCRHANGRDWWLIVERYNSNRHFIFLLDPSGMHLHTTQDIGVTGGSYDWSGNSIFSPDGTKFIKYCFDYGIQVFDFDRCTGTLSNSMQMKTFVNHEIKLASIAVSPNSRFLYLNDYSRIWQYDLEKINMPGCIDTIGFWDGYFFQDVFTTGFYQMALADDGKIYLSCYSSNIYLHVINNPNERGIASNFKLRGLILESWMVGGLPIMPNYQLGPVSNSVCDSLSFLAKHDWTVTFKLYPNPATDEIYFSNADTTLFPDLIIDIYDSLGKKVRTETIQSNSSQRPVSISDLPAALYFIQIKDYYGRFVGRKLVKL